MELMESRPVPTNFNVKACFGTNVIGLGLTPVTATAVAGPPSAAADAVDGEATRDAK